MAEYIVKPTGPFRKDLKPAKKRGLPLSDLYTVMDLLATGKPLPPKYNNHLLHGDYKGYWECHINHNWLLLYEKDTEIRIISCYGNPVYAVVKAAMPIVPQGAYSLRIANDTNSDPERNWKSWRILGGNFASEAEASRKANSGNAGVLARKDGGRGRPRSQTNSCNNC